MDRGKRIESADRRAHPRAPSRRAGSASIRRRSLGAARALVSGSRQAARQEGSSAGLGIDLPSRGHISGHEFVGRAADSDGLATLSARWLRRR